jgi:hypothetical protein
LQASDLACQNLEEQKQDVKELQRTEVEREGITEKLQSAADKVTQAHRTGIYSSTSTHDMINLR